MSFLRHLEIYPSDGGASRNADAPAHRLDEFPTGYSLAGWSPPEPASASPTGSIFMQARKAVNLQRQGSEELSPPVLTSDSPTNSSDEAYFQCAIPATFEFGCYHAVVRIDRVVLTPCAGHLIASLLDRQRLLTNAFIAGIT